MPLVNSVQWIGHFRVPNSHFQNEVKLAYVVNGIFGLAAREMDREPNSERRERGRGRKETLPFFPTPSPLFYSRHFSRGLWLSFLVLCSETTRKRLLDRLKLSAKPLWWKWAFLAWEYKKNHFQIKGFSLSLGLKQRLKTAGEKAYCAPMSWCIFKSKRTRLWMSIPPCASPSCTHSSIPIGSASGGCSRRVLRGGDGMDTAAVGCRSPLEIRVHM